MVKLFKKIIFKSYVLALLAFTVWYGYFMYPLIFGFEGKEEAAISLKEMGKAGTDEEKMFVRLIAEKTKRSKIDLGYRVIDQPFIEGRFHHIGFTIQEDKTSTCIRCHGNVPHNQSAEIRSFLNMHTFYLACETCHAASDNRDKKWVFRWYDKETGNVTSNPPALVEIEDMFRAEQEIRKYPVYGNYGAKVAPGIDESGHINLLHSEKDMAFVERYLVEQHRLDGGQKSEMNREVHRKLSKDPVECKSCHQKTDQYIPFAELGYPPTRLRELTNVAVVGMIKKYKEFYIPTVLNTGSEEERSK